MGWKGIVASSAHGDGMTVAEFQRHVDGLTFGSWRPSFMVLHNTAAPTLAQWKAYPAAQRILNLERYYRDQQHWSAGPHAFVADDLIWPFTPFTTPGVHSPSFNGTALGIELVGDYAREDDDRGDGFKAKMNAVAVFAILHAKLGLNPETIKFHKEDPRTTHDCPGKNIEKPEFIRLVQEYMGTAGEHPKDELPIFEPPAPTINLQDEPPPPEGKVSAVVDHLGLNMREQSSASSKVLGVLAAGQKVAILGSAMNGTTEWLHIWVRLPSSEAKSGWVAARYIDKSN